MHLACFELAKQLLCLNAERAEQNKRESRSAVMGVIASQNRKQMRHWSLVDIEYGTSLSPLRACNRLLGGAFEILPACFILDMSQL